MKKLSRIVTLFLALALVLSMSAVALADTSTTTTEETKECVVKINVNLTPFVEWTYPSEIVINVPVGTGEPALANTYAIEVPDALIRSNQRVEFGLNGFCLSQSVQFADAPLLDAQFVLAAEGDFFATSGFIGTLIDNGWRIPVTLGGVNTNNNWEGVEEHVIVEGVASEYEATGYLNFCVKIVKI